MDNAPRYYLACLAAIITTALIVIAAGYGTSGPQYAPPAPPPAGMGWR